MRPSEVTDRLPRNSPVASLAAAVLTTALVDLQAGAPCTIRTACGRCRQEYHYCAQDAYRWLTDTPFYWLCRHLGWDWREIMETVLTTAAAAQLAPLVTLVPALAWRIACVLEGEAGVLGAKGMWYVGDTMLSRLEDGQTWDEVLVAYHGYQAPPSEVAMRLAERMLSDPWKPSGRRFAYSEEDRIRMGWRPGSVAYGRDGWMLHFSRDWPGSR